MCPRPFRLAWWCGLALASCSADASIRAPSVREVGLIPNPPGAGGRDGGYSVAWAGQSVWIFGDTFFAEPAADGYQWRASTWSYTADTDASDGLSDWTHALGVDGKPLPLLPHTAAEQAFNDAHNGTPCPAGSHCGARHTAWPGTAVVVNPHTVLIFYQKMETEPAGAYAFTSVGSSIATWSTPAAAAVRPPLRPELAEPTVLFPPGEPAWGAAALIQGDLLYAYACVGGLTSPCLLARVPVASALDRSAWRFYTGSAWDSDWHAARSIFDGAPILSVHYSPYLHCFVAFYLAPFGSRMQLRTALDPAGPWSEPLHFGNAQDALDGNWDYALVAHPELARDGGRREYLSYYQPGKFLDGTIHLLELTYR